MLSILYQDNDLVVINKPPGLLVHKSPIARDVGVFALQELRNQLDRRVYPVHRLDRKTSGVLIFALNEEVLKALQYQFAQRTVDKTYLAIVRGYVPEIGHIDNPLRTLNGNLQEAVTQYAKLAYSELPIPFGKHQTSRYSLVEVKPKTGRMHQIRRHFAHVRHPIIGDRPHGCNKQNRFFKERWQMTDMMLLASSIEFTHPITKQRLCIQANPSGEFNRMIELMGFANVFHENSHRSSIEYGEPSIVQSDPSMKR